MATRVSPLATTAPVPWVITRWDRAVGAPVPGTVTVGLAPKAPVTVTADAEPAAAEDAEDDGELDFAELELQALSAAMVRTDATASSRE